MVTISLHDAEIQNITERWYDIPPQPTAIDAPYYSTRILFKTKKGEIVELCCYSENPLNFGKLVESAKELP